MISPPRSARALAAGDIGLIYVLGANGQLLMHYAAFLGMPWADYIAGDARRRRAGTDRCAPACITMTTAMDEKVAGV